MDSSTDGEAGTRPRRHAVVADLGRRALDPDDLDGLLREATGRVAEALDAEYCAVLDMLAGGDEAVLRCAAGRRDGPAGTPVVPIGRDALAGEALRSDGAVTARDLGGDVSTASVLSPVEGGAAGVSAPIGSDDDPWGVLVAYGSESREFTDRDADFVQSVANALGAAVATDRVARERESLRHAADGYLELDGDGRIADATDGAREMLAPDGRSLLGERPLEALPEPIDGRIESASERAVSERETVTTEAYCPDPVDAWLEVRVLPDETGASVFLRDVTERTERERELARYERLAENLPVGVYRNTPGPDGEFVAVNDAMASIFDADSTAELLAANVSDLYPDPDERAEFSRTLRERGIVEDYELKQETLDGREIWISVTAMRVEEDGEVYFDGIVQDVTERKRAQQRLQEERDMFADGPAVVFRWRNEEGWPVEYVSENVADVLGYEPSELESGDVTYTDLLLDEEMDRIAAEVAENSDATTEQFSHEPYRVTTADGDVRWVRDTTKIVRDDAGEITHYLGYLVDITERTERERELARYETIVEAVNDGVYVVDDEGRFTMVNDAYAEMLGYDREELLGAHVSKVVDREVIERAQEAESSIRGGDADMAAIEAEMRTADGDRVPAEATFAMLPSDDGRQRVGVVRDVSERKARERELERKERRYEAIFEDPNILVGLLEPDGTVLDINQTAMEYIDAGLSDVTGEPFWETPWWGEGDGVQDDVREWTERAADGEYVDFEADLTRPDGEEYTLSGYFRPVTDEDGNVVSIIVSDRDITERRRRERELEESERRYRTLVENFPNGAVVLVGGDLRYRAVGGTPVDGAAETPADLEGERVDEVLSPALADELVPRYRAALDGESSTLEIEHDGRYSRFHVYPVRDDDGAVFAALGMSQDITERTEAKRKLAESERRYRALAEYFPNGIVTLFDHDLVYELAAGQGFDRIPVEPDEVEGRHFRDVWDDETAAALRPVFEAALDGEERSVELTYEGREWIVHGVPITDERGDVFAGMTMAQDITERKARERKLAESERRYRTLVENFPDGAVALYDEDLRYTVAGGQLLDEVGVGPDDRVGNSVYEVYPEEIVAEIEPHFEAALDGEHREFDVEFYGRQLHAYTLPVRDPDGGIFAGMLVVQDVTERREYERKLEASNERLEQFAYAASHDLQEPLRMVSSYLQLIERRYAEELDEDGREYLSFAVDGADRMREMIEGLLAYSRVDTRGDPFEPVELDDVLADVLDDLQVKIRESGAEIETGDLPRVEGDGGQLRQVFQNLLDNAIEYSGDDPPRVRVDAERDGDEWVIEVSDDGIGIDPEEADRVFEVFQRLHARSDHEGTGIGLALVERIVERHGGDIWVDSEPGEGATVSFTLPAVGE